MMPPSLLLQSLLLTIACVQCQVFVTWNGTAVDVPVLIYHDELVLINSANVSTISDPNGPGHLVCSSMQSTPSWRLTDGSEVPTVMEDTSMFRQILETGPPNLSLLTRRVAGELHEPNVNGLWFCDTGVTATPRIYVGIFNRSSGAITTNEVSLSSSSFNLLSDPPTFTLTADTVGGPPTTFTWTRNGVAIANSDTFNISIEVNSDSSSTALEDASYRSTLVVTGNLPGVYQYSVSNRATTDANGLTSGLTIEGSVPPTNLTVHKVGRGIVQISWTPPSTPPSQGYGVTLTSANTAESATTTQTSYAATFQEPGTYRIQVAALSRHLPSPSLEAELTVFENGTLSLDVEDQQADVNKIHVAVTAVVTFAATIALYTVTMLVACYAIVRCHKRRESRRDVKATLDYLQEVSSTTYSVAKASDDRAVPTKENVAYHLVPPDQSTLELEDEIYCEAEPQDYIYPIKKRPDLPDDYAVPATTSHNVISIDIEPEHIYD